VAKLLRFMNCLLRRTTMLRMKRMLQELRAVAALVAEVMMVKMMGKKLVLIVRVLL
jgi:hypothetical protein